MESNMAFIVDRFDADAKIDSQRAQAALARSLARLKAALNK